MVYLAIGESTGTTTGNSTKYKKTSGKFLTTRDDNFTEFFRGVGEGLGRAKERQEKIDSDTRAFSEATQYQETGNVLEDIAGNMKEGGAGIYNTGQFLANSAMNSVVGLFDGVISGGVRVHSANNPSRNEVADAPGFGTRVAWGALNTVAYGSQKIQDAAGAGLNFGAELLIDDEELLGIVKEQNESTSMLIGEIIEDVAFGFAGKAALDVARGAGRVAKQGVSAAKDATGAAKRALFGGGVSADGIASTARQSDEIASTSFIEANKGDALENFAREEITAQSNITNKIIESGERSGKIIDHAFIAKAKKTAKEAYDYIVDTTIRKMPSSTRVREMFNPEDFPKNLNRVLEDFVSTPTGQGYQFLEKRMTEGLAKYGLDVNNYKIAGVIDPSILSKKILDPSTKIGATYKNAHNYIAEQVESLKEFSPRGYLENKGFIDRLSPDDVASAATELTLFGKTLNPRVRELLSIVDSARKKYSPVVNEKQLEIVAKAKDMFHDAGIGVQDLYEASKDPLLWKQVLRDAYNYVTKTVPKKVDEIVQAPPSELGNVVSDSLKRMAANPRLETAIKKAEKAAESIPYVSDLLEKAKAGALDKTSIETALSQAGEKFHKNISSVFSKMINRAGAAGVDVNLDTAQSLIAKLKKAADDTLALINSPQESNIIEKAKKTIHARTNPKPDSGRPKKGREKSP